jgi:release factor glutamine methyltransferase
VTTLAEAAAQAAARLVEAQVASPTVDARWLVEAASGHDPRASPAEELTPLAASRLMELLGRRVAREPLQLIVGSTAFRTLDIACAPGVFVPRPETEILAGFAIDAARAAVAARGHAHVLEPCCGTGAVALSVAAEVEHASVHAADISEAAVQLARTNLAALRGRGASVGGRVEFDQGDLLDTFDRALWGRVDVLVSNPPYLPAGDLATLPSEVAAHDPHAALFGGVDGHELVDALIRAAPNWLAPDGTLLLELDVRRGTEAVDAAQQAGLRDARLGHDLTGAARFLIARGSARTECVQR